jgi:hypothetical protein
MKKYILFLFVFIISFSDLVFAQDDGSYVISAKVTNFAAAGGRGSRNYYYVVSNGSAKNGGGNVKISTENHSIVFQSGSGSDFKAGDYVIMNTPETHSFLAKQKPTQIDFYGLRYGDDSWSKPWRYEGINSVNISGFYPYYNGLIWADFTGYNGTQVALSIMPKKIELYYFDTKGQRTDEATISYNYPITIRATKDFDDNVYNGWKYSIDGSSFYSLPQGLHNNSNTLTFSGKDLPDFPNENYFYEFVKRGGKIYIKIDKDRAESSPERRDLITLTTMHEAPNIILPASGTNPTCYGKSDGKIQINFKRALFLGEKLDLQIKGKNKGIKQKIELRSQESFCVFEDLPADTYSLVPMGYENDNTYTDHLDIADFATVYEPSTLNLVAYSASSQNYISCNGGADFLLSLSRMGGTSPYTLQYKDNQDAEWTNTIPTYYKAGTHYFSINDANNCGPKVINSIVTEPKPIVINTGHIVNADGYGRSNGSFEAIIEQPETGREYKYVWTDEKGKTYTPVNKQEGNFIYSSLSNLPAGAYTLTVSVTKLPNNKTVPDYNTPDGCGCINSQTFTITEPEPISITIKEEKPASCAEKNDGKIVLSASGGIPFSDDKNPYLFEWYKANSQELIAEGAEIISYSGEYTVKVTDSKDNTLVQNVIIPQVEEMQISFEVTDVYCSGNATGEIKSKLTGGTAPFSYYWNNDTEKGEPEIKNLEGGNYKLTIFDSNACKAESTTTIKASEKINYAVYSQNLTCYNSNDGEIELMNISGGNMPYTIKWDDGFSETLRDKLSAGEYRISIIDSKECTEAIYVKLTEPDSIIPNIPKGNYFLCKGQELDLDIQIPDSKASYKWTWNGNSFSNKSAVNIQENGTYKAEITNRNNCYGEQTFIVERLENEIFADFLVAGTVAKNDNIRLINITNPLHTLNEWIYPAENTIVNENEQLHLDLKFTQCGEYEIAMRTAEWGCEKITTKKIIVVEKDELLEYAEEENAFIQQFTITPNPNSGNFEAIIKLGEAMDVKLDLYDVSTGSTINSRYLSNNDYYKENYQESLPTGSYLLRLITPDPKIHCSLKIIIK